MGDTPQRTLELIVWTAALAVLTAGAVIASGKERQAALSPIASVDNAGPRGTAVLFAWLFETGRKPQRIDTPLSDLRGASAIDAIGAKTLVLPAPHGALSRQEVDAVLRFADAGGRVIWAVGPAGSQPALERALSVDWPQVEEELVDLAAFPGRAIEPLAPHPLFRQLTLRGSPRQTIASYVPGAMPVAGGMPFSGASSIPRGSGEVILLSGTSLLENFRLGVGDNLTFWSRVAERGPIAFDEYHHRVGAAAPTQSNRVLALLGAQALLAGLFLAWARGKRLGAIRPRGSRAARRTAADYVRSLAALYRRARAEEALAQSAWEQFRRRLAVTTGAPFTADDEAVARVLSRRAPHALAAYRAAAALRTSPRWGPEELVALTRAVAEVDVALRRRGQARSPVARA